MPLAMASPKSSGKYGKWVAQGPPTAEICSQPPPIEKVRLRILCVPPAGMGGSCYHGWTLGLPRDVEVMPLELPGRGARMGEATAASLPELAANVLDGLGKELLLERPFVIFGHSFGGCVAYEMTQELLRRQSQGWPAPLKVYISACRSPQLADLQHDPDRRSPALAPLGDYDFWVAFERRYGKNPDIQEPTVKAMVRKILQQDFCLLEAYKPSTLKPLPMDLCTVCAKGDRRCRPSGLSAWREVAGAGFRERWFENMERPNWWATVHRYVTDNPWPLLRFLSADLPIVGCGDTGDTYSGIDGPLTGADLEDPVEEPVEEEGGWCSIA